MTRQRFPKSSALTRALRRAGVATLLGSAAVAAMAQPYRIVGPDGSVTYTDKPPMGTAGTGKAGASTASGAANLPYETRQAAARYPVTLYTSRACPGCDQARQYLRTRGIPFNEFSIASNDDLLLLQQRFGDSSLPVVTVGTQTMKGFNSSDMDGYADAAGYPKQARLTGYAWPAAVPLAPTRPASAATATIPSAASPGVTLPPPSKNGIQF